MRISLTLLLIALPLLIHAQAPPLFRYQSVARNSMGVEIENTLISVRISVRDNTATGPVLFRETHSVTTNEFGLFSLSIGGGTAVSGTLGSIDWALGLKYLEIEADFSGGTNYANFGVTQLLSVPYALHAATSGTPILPNGTAIGNTSYWDGSTWTVNSNNLFNNGSRIGIGMSSPQQKLDVFGNINLDLDSSIMFGNKRVISMLGTRNMFVGDSAGIANTIGTNNTFLGYIAGIQNVIGGQNTFIGTETGIANSTGSMNSFLGMRAGYANTIATENTFIGAYAGQSTTEGWHNSFLGTTAGSENTTGSENTFLGAHAGYFNSQGSFNTFVGNYSGLSNGFGNYNTLIGFESDFSGGLYNNATAIGYQAIVNASNSVQVGNSAITFIGGQVGWSTVSDRRLKQNFQDNTIGLDFITALQTVNYEYAAKGHEGIRYSGFIAQDVEAILDSMNIEFSGLVKPKNETDYYSIRYSEFVVPLVRAVQEQNETINNLIEENRKLNERLTRLEGIIETISFENN